MVGSISSIHHFRTSHYSVRMCTETIFIAGRYNKYLRNLSQSPWFDKDDIRIKNSVQEMIEDGIKKFLTFDKCVFSSSGREDVDVRMLGIGRPFVFKILNPWDSSTFNKGVMQQIEEFVNNKYKDMVRVRDLQIVTKESVSKNLKDGEESKCKEYRALCCCSRPLTKDDCERISQIKDLTINQKTPIRVLHRRSWAVRARKIHRMKIEPVKLGDFESVKETNLEKVFALTLLTEAGTYIKEFVHSDFGRTEPSLSTLLTNCDTDLMELDVMVSKTEYLCWKSKKSSTNHNIFSSSQEIYLDWPKPVTFEEDSVK